MCRRVARSDGDPFIDRPAAAAAAECTRPQHLRAAILADRYVGPASLDWWANRSTCLANFEVTVTADGSDWHATAVLEHAGDLDDLRFMCQLDPLFTLQFTDSGDIDLIVDVAVGADHPVLTELAESSPVAL